MAPEDIKAELRRIPFAPFEIFVVGGPSYRIHHPDQCIVLLATVLVGIPRPETTDELVNYEKIDCRLISRIAIIEPPTPAPMKPGDPPTLTA